MHNSTFKNPGKGMKRSSSLQRTPFKQKADVKTMQRGSGFAQTDSLRKSAISQTGISNDRAKPRSTLKSRRPKTSKIRQSANGEYCRLRLMGVCKTEDGNVVWAHSNRGEHGKGGGLKADDEWGAYACYWCHCVYDRQHPRPPGMTLEYVEARFDAGMNESRAVLRAKGLLPRAPGGYADDPTS